MRALSFAEGGLHDLRLDQWGAEEQTVGMANTMTSPGRALAPLVALVFLDFLAVGLPLPVLSGRVHDTLGFGAFVVGLAIGAQSWMTLATRHLAGTRSDARGARRASLEGLVVSALAGAFYALSCAPSEPSLSLLVLLLGRALLGLGESLVITGALAWGVGLLGRERSGLVMAWVGIAMYAALAAGAPLGVAIEAWLGFSGVAAAAAVAPLPGLLAALLATPVEPVGGRRLPFYQVTRLIWLPGVGLSLSALGFGAIAAFATLLFKQRSWAHAPLAMSAFGGAYILMRLFFGHLPDRIGGARVAMASAAAVGLGQIAMLLATSGTQAIAGAGLSGLGFSLAFPAFGVEAMRRVPAQNRGAALGAYAASFDATLALGVPLLGLSVGAWGNGAAFALAAAAALGSLLVAAVLARRSARPT